MVDHFGFSANTYEKIPSSVCQQFTPVSLSRIPHIAPYIQARIIANQHNGSVIYISNEIGGKTKYNGTGIGLSIVKRIIENHQGIITASSELNKGATFDIYIPVA